MRAHHLHARVEQLEAENAALKDRLAALEIAMSAWLPEAPPQFPPTAEGELRRQAAYSEHLLQVEEEWELPGDPPEETERDEQDRALAFEPTPVEPLWDETGGWDEEAGLGPNGVPLPAGEAAMQEEEADWR